MSKVTFTNFASTRTTSVLSSLNTTFSVTPGTGANFPTCAGADWFYCVLTDSLTAPTVREVVKVTSRAADSFSTVVRAQDGTIALNWPSGSYCELRLTKGTMEDLQAQITADLQIANNLSDLSSTVAARANLGLDTMAVQAANSVSISGGAIAGCQITGGTLDLTPIGSISPNTGAFTTVTATGRIAAGWTQVQAYEAAYGAAGTKSLFACADAAGEASQALAQFNNAASASSVNFVKGRGTAAAGSIVQSGDNLGGIYFYGAASGSAIALAASIAAVVDGTPGAVNDMPGRLVFSVSPDGSATAAEALRISSDKTIRAISWINYRGADNASDTNSGYGVNTLVNNALGVANSAFGYKSLEANTSGSYNTAFGAEAAKSAVGALDSITAVGAWALRLTTAGTLTGLGAFALSKNTTGTRNTAVGNVSMLECTTGIDNVAVGESAGATITDGQKNTIIGSLADVTSVSVQNAVAIGYGVTAGTNQTVIGNSNTTETVLRGQVKGGAGTGTGQPVMVGALSVNTTAVGNVGAGTDDLMTYSLPANSLSANGKGVRVTMWGTFANNANAKELYGFFGSGQIAFNIALPTSAAGFWRIVSTTIRTGSNAQTTTSDFQSNTSGGSSAVNMCKTTSTTETDSGAITIKASAVGVSDNDVVQTGMMVEFIN